MSVKRKGINAERDLIHKFWEHGWAAVRIAGSGSSQYPSPDVLAGHQGRRLAIECKVTIDDKKYFPEKEIRLLLYFATAFGAEAWVAVRFLRKPWVFLSIEDLEQTKMSYVVSQEIVERKALSFDELITLS